MKVEDLIELLENLKKEYGNVDVCIRDVIESNNDYSIQDVKIEKSKCGEFYISLQNT